MRILYAVFGYGRGHAIRAASVLSALVDHEREALSALDAMALELTGRALLPARPTQAAA